MSGTLKLVGGSGASTGPLINDGWPSATPTTITETPFGSFFSPDPTEMANAWELPANAGTLRLPTGITQTVPTSAQDRSIISQSIDMVDLYGKLSSGKKLTEPEVQAATQLGGDIARAAQMQGSKGAKAAANAAINEIGTRLNHVGITPEDLVNFSTSKVPPKFATMLQNAGYAVTKNMSFTDMLGETSGPKAQQPLPTMSQGMSVGQYVQGLGNLSKDQITQLQQSMWNSGLYDSGYYSGESKAYTKGVLDTGTILAFRKAMQLSLQSNTPLESVIGGNLPLPQTATPATQNSGPLPGTASTSYVPQTQQSQLQSPLIKAFEAALGRAPSEQELANFTSSYNQEQANASKYMVDQGQSPQTAIDLQTGVPYLPTTPTASAAAEANAMNSNPVEYQAHGIANAFGLLMNLVDRSGTSAFTTPGHSPMSMS